LLHLLTVLVDAGQEKHVAIEAALVAREEIGQHFFIGMTQVRRAVDVVNRGGEKIGTGHPVTLRGASHEGETDIECSDNL
jgi:hypothetical protein